MVAANPKNNIAGRRCHLHLEFDGTNSVAKGVEPQRASLVEHRRPIFVCPDKLFLKRVTTYPIESNMLLLGQWLSEFPVIRSVYIGVPNPD